MDDIFAAVGRCVQGPECKEGGNREGLIEHSIPDVRNLALSELKNVSRQDLPIASISNLTLKRVMDTIGYDDEQRVYHCFAAFPRSGFSTRMLTTYTMDETFAKTLFGNLSFVPMGTGTSNNVYMIKNENNTAASHKILYDILKNSGFARQQMNDFVVRTEKRKKQVEKQVEEAWLTLTAANKQLAPDIVCATIYNKRLCIAMEAGIGLGAYTEKRSLEMATQPNATELKRQWTAYFCEQLFTLFDSAAKVGLVNADINPVNMVMVVRNGQYQPKLIDFDPTFCAVLSTESQTDCLYFLYLVLFLSSVYNYPFTEDATVHDTFLKKFLTKALNLRTMVDMNSLCGLFVLLTKHRAQELQETGVTVGAINAKTFEELVNTVLFVLSHYASEFEDNDKWLDKLEPGVSAIDQLLTSIETEAQKSLSRQSTRK